MMTASALRATFLVPKEIRGMTEHADGVDAILIAIARGELEDGKIHSISNL